MSKLYTTVRTDATKTAHTARGHHWVKATLQSWNGSVQLTLDENGNVAIYAENGSTSIPSHLVLATTLADLLAAGPTNQLQAPSYGGVTYRAKA